ncbi:Ig-like domain-containing protein [Variovorax atrisoli]|uniref:Ig-like domain-containing protein n=1 Tax=Variovorax atrisoli TaxID=3394203 RepID=UPI00339A9E69
MISLKVVSKRSGDSTPVSVSEVLLNEAAVVRVGLSREQIRGMRRVGNDLVITSVSGEVVTVRDFFSLFDGHKSDLVLDDEKGGLWLTGFGEGQGELALSYSGIDTIEPLLLQQDFNFGVLPWLLGGGLAAAGVAGGGGAGDSGASWMALVPSTQLASPADASPPGRPTVNPTNATSITGTAQPGTTIRVIDNTGKEIGSATVAPDGSYVVVPSTRPPHGSELRVVAVDQGGKVSPEARTTVDSVAPATPTIHPTTGIAITGTAEPGSAVTATDARGNVIGSTTAGQDGAYRITPGAPLADGTVIKVVAVDSAGNASTPATTAVDLTAPARPTIDPSNGSTIAGTAEAGSVVTIKDGTGKLIGSTTADAGGKFNFTPAKPPADGTSISVVATDPAGNASQPATTVIDRTPPAVPKVNPTDGNPITGTAEPGSIVTVIDDKGTVIGSAATGANGVYSLTPNRLPVNGELIKVVATDAAGNASAPATAIIDGTPPTPTVDPTNGRLITGTSEPDSVVTVTDGNGKVVGSTTAAANGIYSLAPASTLADGTVIHVLAKDPAGNVGRPATTTVDSRPPDAPQVNPTNGAAISGAAEAGSLVTIKDGTGRLIGSTTADANGKFGLAPAAPLSDGTVLRVTAADAVGNVSAEGSATVDRVPPGAPAVDPTRGNTITGRAEPGSVVTVSDASGNVIGSAAVGANGFYSLAPKTPPADGTVLRVTATDAAGNTGPETRTTVDGVAPARPSVDPTAGSLITGTAERGSLVTVNDAAGNLAGSATADANGRFSIVPGTPLADGSRINVVATDLAGNASQPATTTVDGTPPGKPSIDATNGSLITGSAESGSTVSIRDAAGNVVGSAAVDSNGRYSVRPAKPLAHDTQLGVTATDAAGNTSQPALVTVDSQAPNAPAVKPTNGSVIAGTAEAGSTVTVRDGTGKVIGSATAAADGTYAVTPAKPLDDGAKVTAVATDAAGNASSAGTATVDAVPPGKPTVEPTNGSTVTGKAESGSVVTAQDQAGKLIGSATADASGNYTIKPGTAVANGTMLRVAATDAAGNTGPAATATVDSAAPTAPTVKPTSGSTIAGTAEAGSVVTVKDGAGNSVGSATADGSGNYAVKPATPPAHDTELSVTATDAAGNTSAAATTRVDSKAPDAPTVKPTSGSTIVGTAEAGSLVTVRDSAGNLLGSATAGTNGDYSITPVTPAMNGTQLRVIATDAAGNASLPAMATVDSVAPVITVTILNDANNDGFINAKEKGPDVTVRVSLVAGAAEGDAIGITDGTRNLEVKLSAADVAKGFVDVSFPNPAEGSPIRIAAISQDLAGNASRPAASDSAVLDTTAPATPATVSATDNAGPVQGALGNGGSTDDATPTFAGSGAAPGEIVKVYDGATLLGSATARSDGSWEFTPSGLGPGAHSITHTVTDAAGNTSAASAALAFTVDASAVAVSVTKAGETQQGQQIKTRPAGFTDDTTPTVEGKASPGAVVTIKEGSTVLASATADSAGNWKLMLPTQAEGAHSYKASAVNAAGNSSEASFTLTIDTTPPAVPVVASAEDDVGPVQGALASGAATDDTRPTLSGSGATPGDIITVHDNGSAIGSTTVQSDGRWSFNTASPTAPLSEGEHKLTVTATDPVGNQSGHSAPFVINVDTTPPARPDAISGYADNFGAVQNTASTAAFTDDTTPGFKIGSVAAGLTPSLYVDGAKVAATFDPNTGTLMPTFPLAEGAHSISYTLTDAAGNESPRAVDFRLTVDTTPPSALDASQLRVLDHVGPVQGPLAAGAKTDDSKPEYTGTADPAQVTAINVYDNGNLIGSTAVNADGTWRFTPAVPLALGAHSLVARPVDAAGNIGPATPASTFTLVGDPPAAPAIIGVSDDKGSVTGNVAPDASTDDTTPTLRGTGTVGTVVTVYADGAAVGSTSVASDGTWSVTTSALSGDGTKNLTAQAVDGAGQVSPRTGAYAIVLDTTAPATPAVVTAVDDQGPAQGAIAAGGVTDDTTPTFSGSGVKAGDTIRLYDGGALIGSITVATDGAWSITPSTPLASGAHRITLTVTDAAGNTSAASAPLEFTVDLADVVVSIEQVVDDQGSIKGNLAPGARTDDTTPTLVGKATAGALVTVKEGATVLGSTTADAGGSWRLTLSAQGEGTHSYTATAVNAAGKKGEATIDLTIDTTAPEVPKIAGVGDDVGLVQGGLASGAYSDDTTPTLGGSGAAAGDLIKIYDNGSFLGSATVKADGSWSFTPTTPLAEGAHRFTATTTDSVGNESAHSGSFTVNVDVTPPTAKATVGAISTDTGTSADDFVTSDRTLVATITLDSALEQGATVQISMDNGRTWSNATPVGNNNYQFDNTAVSLPDGSYTFLARVVDAAGNATPSSSQVVIIDNSGPTADNAVAITAYTDDVAPNVGDYPSGTSTNDTTPVLKGTVSGLKAGDVVQVFEGAVLLGTATVNGAAWTFALPVLANGTAHTYKAVIADAAGNKGTASADFSLSVATAVPSQSAQIVGFTDDQAPLTGTFGSGAVTNDTSPLLNGTFSGTLNTGDVIVIYRNGARLGAATMTGGGAWTFQDAGLVDNTSYSYAAFVEDAAGNRGGSSAAFTLTIDQRAPSTAPSIDSVTDDVAPVTGSIASGGTTNDARPELKGSGAEPNGTVRIYDSGTLIGTATVDDAGKWSFTPEAGKELVNGAHSLTASSVDAAGNEGPQSVATAFTIDTIAPSQSTTIVSIKDDQGALQGTVADGGFTDDVAPQLAGTLSAPLQAGEKVVVLRDGAVIGTATMTDATHWTFDDAGLSDGRTYAYTARVEDAGGNRGAISGSYAITIDTSVPAQKAAISTVFDNVEPVQGDVANGGTTNDSQPELRGTITGSLAANEFVAVYRDGVKIGTASISGTSWSYTDTSGLANAASYSYTVRVEDAAGNGGAASSPYVITLKLSGPATTAAITGVNDDVDPQQGDVPNNGYTNDTAPQVSGTISAALQAGEKVVVLRDGKEVGFATMTDATHWTYADSGLSNGSAYVYTARVQDAASNPGAESNAHAIRIDTSAPTQTVRLLRAIDNVDPVSGDIPADGTTNDDTPTLEGTLSAALTGTEQLHVFRNGVHAGTAKVSGTRWTFEDAGLSSGTAYTYEARVMDAAGNAGAASNSLHFTVNTSGVTQTVQILGVEDRTDPAMGNVASGAATNETSPLLTGSISTALGAGDVVQVLRNDKVVGTATVNGTTWSFSDSGLADGVTYSYTARVVNSGGNEGAKSAAYAISLDLTAPGQTAAITSFTDNQDPQQGDFPSGSATNDTTPLLNGTLSAPLGAGEVVAIYRNYRRVGSATMADATTWTFQDSGLVDGVSYVYSAAVIDAAGNKGPSSALFSIAIDRTAPTAAPSIDSVMDNTAPVIGQITAGSTTNETRPQMAGAGAEPNGTVKVYDNGTPIGTAIADGSGKWSFTPEAGKALSNGAHSLTAGSVDAAGNEGPRSAPLAFTVGTTAPAQVATITSISDDTGASASDFITSDTTLVVTAALDAAAATGEKVQISLDNGTSWRDATLVSGNTYRLDNTAVPLAAGDYVFQARVVDAAGNAGKPTSQRVVIDTRHSAGITIDISSISTDTGVAGDFITSDTSLTINGRLTGTLASDETAQISLDGGATWVNLIVSGGNWSYVDGRVLTDGSHDYRVRVVDTAGNLAAFDARTVVVDTSTPTAGNAVAITAYADDVDPNAGDYASGTTTNDTTPVLKGTVSGLKTGEVVQILEGGVLLGTATVNGNGNVWEFKLPTLADGSTHTYTAAIASAAGTKGTTSANFTLTVDTVAPSAAPVIDSVIDNVDPVQGPIAQGGTSNDARPEFKGSGAEANGTVNVYDNGVLIGSTRADAAGKWSFEPASGKELADGVHSLRMSSVDAAGNEGPKSAPMVFTVDTLPPPVATLSLANYSDSFPAAGTLAADQSSDRTSTDNTFDLVLTGTDGSIASYEVSTDGGQHWKSTTAAQSGLADGRYLFRASLTDAAGNSTAAANSIEVNVDRTSPALDLQRVSGVAIAGTTEAGALVAIDIGNNGSVEGSVVADANGNWAWTPPASLPANTVVSAIAYDLAGNASSKETQVVDTTPPVITIDKSDGKRFSGTTSDADTPVVSPTAAKPITVTLSVDKNADGVIDYVLPFTATVTADGAWSIDASAAPVNVGAIVTAVAQDYNGNRSTPAAVTVGGGTSKISGSISNDNFGYDVQAIGDFNGDGYNDFAVVAPHGSAAARTANAWSVNILYGSKQGLPDLSNVANLPGTDGLRIFTSGDISDSNILTAVQGYGDVNGDGYSDVIVYDDNLNSDWVIFGRSSANATSTPVNVDVRTIISSGGNSDGVAIVQREGSSWFGAGGALADVNGDGYADIVMQDWNQGTGAAGTAIIYGHAGAAGSPTWANYHVGFTGGSSPSSYVSDSRDSSVESTRPHTVIYNDNTNGRPANVMNIGDINGDGYTDFAYGLFEARNPVGSIGNAGAIQVIYGTAKGFPQDYSLQTDYINLTHGFRVYGEQENQFLGTNIDPEPYGYLSNTGMPISSGDINGDGIADLIIGSPQFGSDAGEQSGPGRVYVVYGKAGGASANFNLANLSPSDGFVITASDSTRDAMFGNSTSVGDFNGDGIDDIAIGAPLADVKGMVNNGAVYIVYGQQGGYSGPLSVAASYWGERTANSADVGYRQNGNASSGSMLGVNVALSDLNGDGQADLALGSPYQGSSPTPAAGYLDVVYSSAFNFTNLLTVGNDVIAATAGRDRLSGGAGDDVITDVRAGDSAYGGAGNDRIHISEITGVVRVDGGLGIDTLVVDASNLTLDLPKLGLRVQGFENFDLGTGANNTGNVLRLRLSDVLNQQSSMGTGNGTGQGHMRVTGDNGDAVQLLQGAGSWSSNGSTSVAGVNYTIYHNSALPAGNTLGDVWVQQGVRVVLNSSAASNISTLSQTVAIKSYTDDQNPQQGDFASGSTTNDTTPQLNGTLAGSLGSGEVVVVYRDDTRVGTATMTGAATWTFQDSNLSDGATYRYTARVEDGAGNAGVASTAFTLAVDLTPPTARPSIDGAVDDVGPAKGILASGATTDDANPVLTGTLTAALSPGEVVRIYEGTTVLGTATVTGTAWTYDLGNLADGSTHTYRAVVADAAGSEGPASGNFSLTVDYAVIVDRQTTVDTTPLVTGSLPFKLAGGQYIEVTVAGKTYSSADGSVVVDSQNNTWYVQVPSAVATGTYDVQAVIKNGTGVAVVSDDTTGELVVSEQPKVTVGSAASDPNQKGTAYTIGENGMWRIHSNQTMLDADGTDSASLGSFRQTYLRSNTNEANVAGNNPAYAGPNYVQNATFMDFDRNGYMDLFTEDSSYADGQQAFSYDGRGYTAVQVGAPTALGGDKLTVESANVFSWYGGVVAFDKTGDGFVDLAYGDQTPDDGLSGGGYNTQIVLNNDGSILGMVKDRGYTYTREAAGTTPSGQLSDWNSTNAGNATFDMELSGVDLNNDGKVDVVYHGSAGTTKIGGPSAEPFGGVYSSNPHRLVVATNKGDGTWENTQIINDTFQRPDDDPYVGNAISMTWADFNGDGYMDLFMGRGFGQTSELQYQSRILFNDGKGQLSMVDADGDKIGSAPSGMYLFDDADYSSRGSVPQVSRLQGGPSLAVDWNADGKMDAIELPGFGPTGGMTAEGNTGPINLYTNTSSGGGVAFDKANLLGGSNTIGMWTGNDATNNAVTGAIAVDIDWDGDRDLLAFTQRGNTKFITNTNTVADGTALHFRILDAQGINALYGNTVQLFDSKGKLVSTQMINPQSGNQTNDSSAIVDFYGLDASETYTLALLRIANGKAADVGGLSSLGGNTIENVNAAWTGLKAGAANHAFVLTAESDSNVANANIGNGIVGTGYNDTFFATLGNDKYEGGGGTVTVSGVRAWSNTGGVDVVDYKLAGSTPLTIDLSKAGVQSTGFGSATFSNIEGLAGGSGADVFTDNAADNQFEGRGGNDVFNLTGGGRDTLLYKLLASSDATGGNGADSVNSFTVGTFEATANADRIDIRELLVGYKADADGAARYINGVATIDAGETIGKYLSVTVSGGNTTLYIDRDGAGGAYSATQLITLNGVTTDLATLLANHQLVLA